MSLRCSVINTAQRVTGVGLAMGGSVMSAAIWFGYQTALLVGCAALAALVLLNGRAFVALGVASITFTAVAVGPLTLSDALLLVGGLKLAATRHRFITVPAWVLAGAAGVVLPAVVRAALGGDGPRGGDVRMAVAMALVPVVVSWAGDSDEWRRRLASFFVLSAVINASVALLTSIGVAVLSYLPTGVVLPSQFNAYRVSGLTTHPNQLGLVCALALPFVLCLYRDRRTWALAGMACLVGIGLSGSRTGLVAAVLGTAGYLVLSRRVRVRSVVRAGLLGAAAVMGLAVLGADVSIERLLGQDHLVGQANQERAAAASDAWEDFVSSPLIGVGFEGAHNIYLTLAQGGGIVALGAFAIYLRGCRRSWRAIEHRTPVDVAAGAFVVVWLLASFTHNGYYDRFLYFGVAMVLAARTGAPPTDCSPGPASPSGLTRSAPTGA